MKRLLLALLLACSGVVLFQVPAHACTCVTDDVDTSAGTADAVFAGTLTEVAPTDPDAETRNDGPGKTLRNRNGANIPGMTYVVSVDRVYQGTIAATEVEITSAATSCSLGPLDVDERYIFFVNADGSALSANQCGGTDKANDTFTGQVEEVLGSGTAMQKPEPVEAEMTPVAGAAPTPFPRLAAPGGAVVLIGLLGLIVVRRLGRMG